MRQTVLLAVLLTIVIVFVSQGCATTKPDDSSPYFVEMVDKDGKPLPPNARPACSCKKCRSYGDGVYSGPACCFPWPGACG